MSINYIELTDSLTAVYRIADEFIKINQSINQSIIQSISQPVRQFITARDHLARYMMSYSACWEHRSALQTRMNRSRCSLEQTCFGTRNHVCPVVDGVIPVIGMYIGATWQMSVLPSVCLSVCHKAVLHRNG